MSLPWLDHQPDRGAVLVVDGDIDERWQADGIDARLEQVIPRDRGGLEILRRVRASGRSTAAIMVTSMSEFSEVREAMRLGAQDYVPKDELCPEILLPLVEGQRERLLLKGEVKRLRERVDGDLVGAPLRRLFAGLAPVRLPAPDPRAVQDVDTPEDLERARRA